MQSKDFIKAIEFNSAKELFDALSPYGEYSEILDQYVFRGESSEAYTLLPSALRVQNKERLYQLGSRGIPIDNQSEWEVWQQYAEFYALKQFHDLADSRAINVPDVSIFRKNKLNPFIFEAYSETWIPEDLHEIAALAQHFGIPTRLLDWSLNVFTALYFAVSGAIKNFDETDRIVLWALNYQHIEFLKSTVNRIPIDFITPPYFRNENVYNQNGVLTNWNYPARLNSSPFAPVTLVNREPLDKLISDFVLNNSIDLKNSEDSFSILMYKFTLPTKEAIELYEVLSKLGFGADTIYSGLNGIVKKMEEDALFLQLNEELRRS